MNVQPLSNGPLQVTGNVKMVFCTGRAKGKHHGSIHRLISPEDLGDRLKPFIFLDFFDAEIEPGFGFGMHPHSGITTPTCHPDADMRYSDTTDRNGILKVGGLEWMSATATPHPCPLVTGPSSVQTNAAPLAAAVTHIREITADLPK